MANHTAAATVNIRIKDLDRFILQAVRDEIARVVRRQPGVFYLEPKTPLYEDMKAIAQTKKRGKIKIYSREEAFGG